MIVVDASVAVKWYLQEQASEQAAEVLTGLARPIGPELLRLEVISALCNQSRLYNANPEHIRVLCARWMADLGRFSVRLHDQASLMEPAWNMALRFQHPVYDCIYLALAEEQGVPLVTADDVFVTKVAALFPRAQLLAGMAKS